MEPVNIKKLAQLLNLSISTVSKALKDKHDISQETKERVIALAKEMNYHPNPHASSLRINKSRTIAVIIPELVHDYFVLVINGIESVAQEKGYHVLIYLTHEDYQKEVSLIKTLHSGRVDGLLLSISNTTADYTHLEELQKKGLPVVFFDRVCENLDTVSVTTDDYESAFNATKHLIDQGCRKIAHLMITRKLSIGMKRMLGYADALRAHNLPVDHSLIVNCTDDKDSFELIRFLLQTQKPDGVFSAVESYALTTYEVCKQLGLSIPDDVKIVSFSNLKTAALLNPSLTTVTQPAFEIGKQAGTILFKALEKKSFQLTKEQIIIKSTLHPRKSTAK